MNELVYSGVSILEIWNGMNFGEIKLNQNMEKK